MSTIPPATPSPDADDPKQAAYEALSALLDTATAAANNPANTKAAQDAAFALRTTTAAQLDALDQADFTSHTVALQASAAELSPGITELEALRTQIKALGNDLKEAASILSGIDSAIAELKVLGTM